MGISRVKTILLLSLMAVFGLVVARPAPIVAPKTPVRHQVLPAFNAISLSGTAHVLVDQAPSRKKALAAIHTTKAYPVKLVVKNHTLFISAPNQPTPFQPFVHLRLTQPLKRLVVNNHISIVLMRVNTEKLQVVANNYAKVSLIGLVDINRIEQNDQSSVNVQWVDSDKLTVNVKNQSQLTLSGAANQLIANAADQAQVKAEYLRTLSAWVKAEDAAAIYITPIKFLSGWANNNGHVYYYKYPQQLDRHTTASGNVLQIAWHQ